MDFSNKVIIVTGGGTGIGRSTCIELAKTGIKQVIGNRNEEKGNEVVEIIRKNGGEAEFQNVKIRGTLSNIGLSFDQVDENAMVESKGSMSFPLTAFGGRFGKDVDTPHNEFLNDDGISHIVEGGLSLHISYEKTDTNQCRLRAHIE